MSTRWTELRGSRQIPSIRGLLQVCSLNQIVSANLDSILSAIASLFESFENSSLSED
jgi:hypothetical protein